MATGQVMPDPINNRLCYTARRWARVFAAPFDGPARQSGTFTNRSASVAALIWPLASVCRDRINRGKVAARAGLHTGPVQTAGQPCLQGPVASEGQLCFDVLRFDS